MKKIILTLIVITQFSIVSSAPIAMPHKDELQKIFDSITMAHFSEQTDIIKMLANQKKEPLEINAIIESSINTYFKYLEQLDLPLSTLKAAQAQVKKHKPSIFKALLKEKPEALKELEELSLFKPN